VAASLGTRIRKLREKHALTQQSLAERAGMSISFLSEIENDKRNCSGRMLLQLSTALGTTMDYLARGVEPAPSTHHNEPTSIPPELAEAAEQAGLSYRATVTVHEAYRQIVARRGTEPDRKPTSAEWLAMYRALRKYIEE